ncbi:MAG TPA: YafY family protein [Roseiarcus sp.]|nr:YafY family protein [Roseiarcus sp.]
MRKASRLFEIIQTLRLAKKPVTAAEIAESLEVAARTVYRDIVALQAMRVPIEGGRGVGYILRPGFDLPPLMFTIEETEALVVALALLERTGDVALKRAAKLVNKKLAAAIPLPLRKALADNALYAWGTIAPPPEGVDLGRIRHAIREEQKLKIAYRDEGGRATSRTIRPIALIYYSEAANVVAWCELRQALRNFRADRVQDSVLVDEFFRGEGENLRRQWIEGWKEEEKGAR